MGCKQYDGAHCPLCGGSDISSEGPTLDESSVTMVNAEVNCENCGATWTEVFSLNRVVDVKDKDGKVIKELVPAKRV